MTYTDFTRIKCALLLTKLQGLQIASRMEYTLLSLAFTSPSQPDPKVSFLPFWTSFSLAHSSVQSNRYSSVPLTHEKSFRPHHYFRETLFLPNIGKTTPFLIPPVFVPSFLKLLYIDLLCFCLSLLFIYYGWLISPS